MGNINIQQNKNFRDNANTKIAPVEGTDWCAFLDALGRVEGNNRYDISNGVGYYGIYQQGRAVVESDLDFFQSYGNFLDVHNLETFKNNPIAQELAGVMEFSGESGTDAHFSSKYTATKGATSLIPREHFDALQGKTFTVNWSRDGETLSNTFTVNKASISGAAHLIGQGGVARALETVYQKAFDNQGNLVNSTLSLDPNDKYLADGNHIAFSTYMELFDAYNIDPLIAAKDKDDFIELYGDLLHYRKDKLTEYITAHENLVLDNKPTYQDEIQTTVNRLGGDGLSIRDKEDIIFAGNNVSNATKKDDLIISLDNGKAKTLNAGIGHDTYKVNAKDTISDSDKKGEIYFNATLLSGAKHKVSEGVYADKMFTYTEKDKNLIIAQKEDPSKSITVEHWDRHQKMLDIELSEQRVEEKLSFTLPMTGVGILSSEIAVPNEQIASLQDSKVAQTQEEYVHPASVQAVLDKYISADNNVQQNNDEVELQ